MFDEMGSKSQFTRLRIFRCLEGFFVALSALERV